MGKPIKIYAVEQFKKKNKNKREMQVKKDTEMIKKTLNHMQKLNSKESYELLNNINAPVGIQEELSGSVADHVQQIEKNLHASASDKLKSVVLGGIEKMSEKEKTRREYLTQNVVKFGAVQDAYVDFFVGCSDAGKIFNSFLTKFNGVAISLGPKGKRYISSEKELRINPLWKQCYDGNLSKLSKKYNFRSKTTANICYKGLKFISPDFSTEVGPSFTTYKNRAKIVYQKYRSFAVEIKKEIEKLWNDRLNKLSKGDKRYRMTEDTNLEHLHQIVIDEIGFCKTQLENLKKFMLKNNKIFKIPLVKDKTKKLLDGMERDLEALKLLSKHIVAYFASSLMKNSDNDLSETHESLIASANTFFNWLRDLKSLLLQGQYDNAVNTLESLNHELNNIVTFLEGYATVSKNFHSKNIPNQILKLNFSKINEIEDSFKKAKESFDVAYSNVTNTPEEYKKQKAAGATNIILNILRGSSNFLGIYANAINALANAFVPQIAESIMEKIYTV